MIEHGRLGQAASLREIFFFWRAEQQKDYFFWGCWEN
jgi:hypothetical protein